MKNGLPIVFAVYREAAGPVFASQVVGQARWLSREGCDVAILSFIPIGSWFRGSARRGLRQLRASVREQLGDGATWLPAAPSRLKFDPLAAILLAVWLRMQYGSKQVVLHCRGRRMTELGLQVRRRRSNLIVVYDCRGIDHAENDYQQSESEVASAKLAADCRRQYALQRHCVREADRLLCVSHAMKRYISEEYQHNLDLTHVIPCVVDVDRFAPTARGRDEVRSELGFEGKLVVVYNGSLHAWQMPTQCIRVFRLIRELESNAHFLALTTNPDEMHMLAIEQGLKHEYMTIMRVSHERVPRYLAAADVGLLVRKRSLVNQVASPVKFGEYLAAGLPIIMTDGIGDYSELANLNRVGLVFDLGMLDEDLQVSLSKFLDRMMKDRQGLGEQCKSVARTMLSPDRCYPILKEVYDGRDQMKVG